MTSSEQLNERHPAKAKGSTRSAVETVNEYLNWFYTGDFERARSVVAEDFSFIGPFLKVEGKNSFFAGADGLRKIVCGHRLLRQWEDHSEVSSVYEVAIKTQAAEGSLLMSEWHTVSNGELVSGRIIFDTAVFRSLVPKS